MFYLGLAAILLVALLLGLTILRVLEKRPAPNAELLAEMLGALDRPAPEGLTPTKPASCRSETKTA